MSGNCTLIFPSCCSETGNGAAVVVDGGIELKMKVEREILLAEELKQ